MLTKEMRKHVESNWNSIPEEDLKTYLFRLRSQIKQALKDLALVTEKLPEDQLEQVLTAETLDPFFSALLLPEYDRGRDKETQQRRFEIAALMMQKGIVKCLEREQPPHLEPIRHDATILIHILSSVATGEGGASLDYGPRQWNTET